MFSYSLDTAADEWSDRTRDPALSRSDSDLSRWKRIGAGAVGGALVAFGLGRRSLGGAAIALVGGWMAYRAVGARSEGSTGAETVAESITIGKPADELSEFARDAANLNRLVGPFADVTALEADRHRWTVHESPDQRLSWETRLVEDRPGDRLRWEPADGTALIDGWSMSFRPAPGDRGTEVTLEVGFAPPGGSLGTAVIEKLDVVPESLVGGVLDRFKSLAETGEIPTTEGNPSARGRGDLL
ncbi:SRPBCC family protein [Natronorubrum halophilum]|uniref:SRPBCC family protein n=1 Tax=Natronorubrum halophilum TaxID=1702106 RepID=UPI000EF72D8F|nr:polyketide cyclase/dehydrase [Natronorubrum halophilum]